MAEISDQSQSLRFGLHLCTSILSHSQVLQPQQQLPLTLASVDPMHGTVASLWGTPSFDLDIIILDKEKCWQHWTCSYSLWGEIRALDTQQLRSTTLNNTNNTTTLAHQLHELALIVYIHCSIQFSISPFHSIFQSSDQRHLSFHVVLAAGLKTAQFIFLTAAGIRTTFWTVYSIPYWSHAYLFSFS